MKNFGSERSPVPGFYDSFRLSRDNGITDQFLQLRQTEIAAAQTSLSQLKRYQHLRTAYLGPSKKPLSLQDAMVLSLVDGGSLFLYDPYSLVTAKRTPTVLRTLKLLEYMGKIKPHDLEGNILLVGSGHPEAESLAVSSNFSVSHIETYAQAARPILDCVVRSPSVPSNEYRAAIEKYQESLISGMDVNERVPDPTRRMIVALDPDPEVQRYLEAGNVKLMPACTFVGDSLQSFLHSEQQALGLPNNFSLIAGFRVDPRIFSPTFDGPFIQDQDPTHFREMYLDIIRTIRHLFKKLGDKGKLLLTVGSGNLTEGHLDEGQHRILFINAVNDVLSRCGIPTTMLTDNQLAQELSCWIVPSYYRDVVTLVATKTTHSDVQLKKLEDRAAS